jgi:hypothetical protein
MRKDGKKNSFWDIFKFLVKIGDLKVKEDKYNSWLIREYNKKKRKISKRKIGVFKKWLNIINGY